MATYYTTVMPRCSRGDPPVHGCLNDLSQKFAAQKIQSMVSRGSSPRCMKATTNLNDGVYFRKQKSTFTYQRYLAERHLPNCSKHVTSSKTRKVEPYVCQNTTAPLFSVAGRPLRHGRASCYELNPDDVIRLRASVCHARTNCAFGIHWGSRVHCSYAGWNRSFWRVLLYPFPTPTIR